MELRHLRYFVAVAEALSFTKAAEKLRLAQPSLTRQVRNLEEEIGVRLLERANNRVALTEEGRRFFFDARKLLAMCAESVAAVQRMNSGETSQLNIGYVANIHYGLLPATLGAFRKLCPSVALNLFDLTSAEQFQALDVHKIDLGFVGLRPALSGQDVLSEGVASDTILLAVSERHALAKKAKLQLADLAPLFFIGMSGATHPGAREWLLETCRGAGFEGKILQEADVEPTAIRFVADGLGVALMPEQITGRRTRAWSSARSPRRCGANPPSRGWPATPPSRSRITSRSSRTSRAASAEHPRGKEDDLMGRSPSNPGGGPWTVGIPPPSRLTIPGCSRPRRDDTSHRQRAG